MKPNHASDSDGESEQQRIEQREQRQPRHGLHDAGEPEQQASHHRAVARGDRERKRHQKPEHERGEADPHMAAEIVRQMRQRFTPARIGKQAHVPPRGSNALSRSACRRGRRQEFADIGVVALRKLRWRALRQQLAAAHDSDTVGQQYSLGHVVGDHDRGESEPVVERAVIVAKPIARQGIERAERFVHQHDFGACRERPRHADALALAAGEFMRKAVAKLFSLEPHQIEQFIDPCGDIGLRLAFQLRRDADIGGDAHMRE